MRDNDNNSNEFLPTTVSQPTGNRPTRIRKLPARNKDFVMNSLFTTQSGLLMTLKKALENTVGKEENAGIQHFLLFPQCFQLYHKEKLSF